MICIDLGFLLIVHYMGKQFFPYRFQKSSAHLLIFLLYIILTVGLNDQNLDTLSVFKPRLSSIIYFAYLYLQFVPKLSLALLTSIFIYIIQYITVFLSALILNVWNPFFVNANTKLLILCLSLCINLLMTICFIKLVKMMMQISINKYHWRILILPVFTCFLLFKMRDYYSLVNRYEDILFLILGLIIVNYLTLYFYIKSMQTMQLKMELTEEKLRQESLEIKYELLNQHYQNNFNFLHDLLHRGNRLYQTFYQKEFGELETEINELNQIAFKEFNAIYSNNFVLNTLISENMNEIKKRNLEIRTEILSDLSFLSLNEQIELFNHLLNIVIHNLDNKKILNPYLLIRVLTKGNLIIVKTTFSSKHEISIKNEQIKQVFKDKDVKFDSQYNNTGEYMQYLIMFKHTC